MSVLILGATSPIAHAVAARYAGEGKSVAIAARSLEEAERIASDLAVRYQVETRALAFDALDFDGHGAFVESVEAELGAIEVALLAFGDMGHDPQHQEGFGEAHRVIDVNYTGAVSVAERLAGAMAAHGRGCIIGIASVAGDRGRASNYIYGSAKGAFALYLQGLRNRLFADGVHVMTVKLGFVDTRMTWGMKTKIPVASPDAVAGAIVGAARHKLNTFYYPPFWAGIMGVIKAIPEEVFKRLSL